MCPFSSLELCNFFLIFHINIVVNGGRSSSFSFFDVNIKRITWQETYTAIISRSHLQTWAVRVPPGFSRGVYLPWFWSQDTFLFLIQAIFTAPEVSMLLQLIDALIILILKYTYDKVKYFLLEYSYFYDDFPYLPLAPTGLISAVGGC